MQVGAFQYISLVEAVEAAKEDLRIQDTTEHDPYLFRKADEALRHTGAYKNYVKKVCKVDILDGRAKLPVGLQRLTGLRFVDGNGICYGQPYLDLDFLNNCGCNDVAGNYGNLYNPHEVQDGYIVFHDPSNISATQANIAYMGRNVDSDGVMYMSDREERAVIAYLCYHFSLAYPEGYTQHFNYEKKREWTNQKKYLRGLSQKERFEENKRQISAIFKAWILSDQNV